MGSRRVKDAATLSSKLKNKLQDRLTTRWDGHLVSVIIILVWLTFDLSCHLFTGG